MLIITHLFREIQIISLKIDKTIIIIKYLNFTNIYISDFEIKFLEYTSINNYFINIVDNKQLSYS